MTPYKTVLGKGCHRIIFKINIIIIRKIIIYEINMVYLIISQTYVISQGPITARIPR